MKKLTRIVVVLLLVVLSGLAAVTVYVKIALPNVGQAPDLKVAPTPERIARGAYLANHVTVCIDCHSTRDWSLFAGPLKPGSEGAGGEVFNQQMGFPGSFYAPNITPYHLKRWTDGELFRAITAGVTREGKPIFPVMPYKAYGKMDKEDIYAIIAYLRTLPPLANTVPASKADFPVNILINTMPAKGVPGTRPADTDNSIARGAYLFTAAACADCHTPQKNGQPLKELENAGGFAFTFPNGVTYSSNITPDKETGIGNWTKEQFITRFRLYANLTQPATLLPDQPQTVMPWTMYGKMTPDDLAAIYDYLQTLSPIRHKVRGE